MATNPSVTTGTTVPAKGGSYFEWGALIGGAVVAVTASTVFVAFGAAIGLGVVAPWGSDGAGATTVGIIGAVWFLVSSAAAYYFGGYIAGRMRATWGDATSDEVEMRDALHGAVVWAVGVLVFFWIGTATVSSVATGAAQVGSAAAGAVGSVVQSEAVGNMASYTADKLFRSETPATGARADSLRQQAATILARAVADGELTEDDKTYLVQLVASQTSLSEEEAAARVDEVFAEAGAAAQQAADAAEEAADTAQNATLLLGFMTAAGFLIALVAAWFGAVQGGSHRDSNTVSKIFVT